jgi:hypothetical protein
MFLKASTWQYQNRNCRITQKRGCIISQMKVMRIGNTEFDSNAHPNKKEAVTIYETASKS